MSWILSQIATNYNATPPVTYATWNPSDKNSAISLSNWDLTATWQSPWYGNVRATIGKLTGKWYWEVVHSEVSSGGWQDWIWTISTYIDTSAELGARSWVRAYREYDYGGWTGDLGNTGYYINFSPTSTPLASNVFWYALDCDNGTFAMYKNWVLQYSSGIPAQTYTFFPIATIWSAGSATYNFWATPFAYTPPVWFNAWLYE